MRQLLSDSEQNMVTPVNSFQTPNHKAKFLGYPVACLLCAVLAPPDVVHLWVFDLLPAPCKLCGAL